MRITKKLGKLDADFAGLSWAIKAKDEAGARYDLVKFDKGVITCTDGKRLHSYTSKYEVPDGVYRVVKINQNAFEFIVTEDKFPNIDVVMPCKNGTAQKYLWKYDVSPNSMYHKFVAEVFRKADVSYAWEPQYLIDAFVPGVVISFLHTKENGTPLWIVSDNGQYEALVMPVYIPDWK